MQDDTTNDADNKSNSYLRTRAQCKFSKGACFGEVNEQQKEGQSLTGRQERINCPTLTSKSVKKDSMLSVSLLEACEFFIKKVNDNCAEYKTGEYGEKTSNACMRAHQWTFSFFSVVRNTFYILDTLNIPETRDLTISNLPKIYLDPSCLKFWNWK